MSHQLHLALQRHFGLNAYIVYGLLGLAAIALVFLLMPGPLPHILSAKAPLVEEAVENPGEPWGIEVLGIRRSAADYMLDFRYRVLDADKAAYLMDRKIQPQLLVEKTGQVLRVPVSAKIGPLRQSPKYAKAERQYFMFFANPGRSVKAGDKVTVMIGDFKAAHLIVE